QAIFHGDMLAAPIFEVGGLAHRRDGLPFAALDERDPGLAGQLLYGHLAGPISEYPATFRYSGHTAFAAIPVRYAFERAAWAEAAALAIPRTPFAQAEAIAWFGRAVGAARNGELAKAKDAVDQLRVLKDKLNKASDE